MADKYKVTLTTGDEKHTGKGDSVYSALKSIKPYKAKKMTTVEVEVGKEKIHIPLRTTPLQLTRLFENDTTLQIFSKRIETLR